MPLTLTHAGLSDPGPVHLVNEDRWLAEPAQGLYLVSDGMANEQAPRIVVERLPALLHDCLAGATDLAQPKAAIAVRWALNEVSQQIRHESEQQPELKGLGATVVLLLIRDLVALVAHLGDSRAYRWRQGQLERLTEDHSLFRRLFEEGRLTAAELARQPMGGGPVQFAGMPGTPAVPLRQLELQPSDVFLLCSDGLHGMLGDQELALHFAAELPPAETCRALIAAANAAAGQDNLTALIVAVGN